VKHTVIDSGGIVRNGIPAAWDSLWHAIFGDPEPQTPEPPGTRAAQMECVKSLGGCNLPGGIPTQEDLVRWNEECRQRLHYQGDNVFPTAADCANPGSASDDANAGGNSGMDAGAGTGGNSDMDAGAGTGGNSDMDAGASD
jgi:hypothetical protein